MNDYELLQSIYETYMDGLHNTREDTAWLETLPEVRLLCRLLDAAEGTGYIEIRPRFLSEHKEKIESNHSEKTVGERIRNRRKALEMTQEELAGKLGITSPAVRSYEAGRRNPKPETIKKIADALECDPTDLWNPNDLFPTSEVIKNEIS